MEISKDTLEELLGTIENFMNEIEIDLLNPDQYDLKELKSRKKYLKFLQKLYDRTRDETGHMWD